jgi:hypothetical protein
MRIRRVFVGLFLLLSFVTPAAAQGLDALLFVDPADLDAAADVQAEVIQLYRLLSVFTSAAWIRIRGG